MGLHPTRRDLIAAGLLVLGLASLCVSSLAVIEAPTNRLWMLAVGVTEWGHWLALAAMLPVLLGLRISRLPWFGRLGLVCWALAALLCLAPLWRAWHLARQLPADLALAFGEASGPPHPPLDLITLFTPFTASAPAFSSPVYAERDGQALRLDLYEPVPADQGGLRPGVIVIHGGSWQSGDSRQLPDLNSHLARHGYVVASINYRLSPGWKFPAAVEDVQAAIDYLESHAAQLSLDSTRLVLLGRSAGGQLALLAGYRRRDPGIRGVIAFYAPTDLAYSYRHPANPAVFDSRGTLEAYLGGSLEAAGAAYEAASPVTLAAAQSVPTLLIHGGRDELVSPVQSERLTAALSRTGQRHFLLRLPWATHGCDHNFRGPCGQLSTYAIERFLEAVTSSPLSPP
jgi:acetyl esterase/lipase